jgi:hypothetical protein
MAMRAIPMTYKGTTFRSRLEASWAAHFDQRGMPWDYEPEGFVLSDGTRYLPDFYVPTARAWAEIKGDHDQRIEKVERFAAELWQDSGIEDQGRHEVWDAEAPMVVLLRCPREDPGWPDGIWHNISPFGIRGPGKGYSVTWARCNECGASTMIALWQKNCRNCGHIYDDAFEAWDDFDWRFRMPFQYLPSPYKPPR